jgi:multiple sugar transport system ATP-binding protein
MGFTRGETMARVLIQNVRKTFGSTVAVDDVNLVIEDQEFCVIVGPSGCGKTTLLRMIAGLEKPTAGHIHLGDQLIDDVPPGRRDIGMVFQNYALFAHMNVYNNLCFGLKIRKHPKEEIHGLVSRIATMLKIEHLLDRYPRQLSGGERQRVALGRALIRNPRLFLMDEPLSNLDALLRIQMRSELLRLIRSVQGTVIYVTHDQTEALSMGDKLVLLRNGKVQQVGSPDEVYNRPVNRFVATFLGSPTMNFISEGSVKQENGTISYENAGLKLALPEAVRLALARRPDWEEIRGDLLLGIRPEAIYFSETADARPTDVQARVELVQSLGAETIVSLSIGPHWVQALTDPSFRLHPSDQVPVYLDMRKVYLFRESTGETILPVEM